jgi:hypothetical protein
MTVGFIEPLRRAFHRMRSALFQPFQLEKWIYVGFASWIAGWGVGGGYGYNWNFPGRPNRSGSQDPERVVRDVLEQFWTIVSDPAFLPFLLAFVVAAIALGTVLLWLHSRGEFVFIDAVVHDRRAIVAPWNALADQGNSLFVWRLLFGLLVFGAFAAIVAFSLAVTCRGQLPLSWRDVPWASLFLLAGALWFPLFLVTAYVGHFLTQFVTPIMYRDRVTASEAWGRFLVVFRQRPGTFLSFGLFSVGLSIAIVIALIPAILLTCCLLGCFLLIPFVGTVMWLPVSYALRAFGPEFLAQFGEDVSVWTPPPLPPPPTRIDMQVSGPATDA